MRRRRRRRVLRRHGRQRRERSTRPRSATRCSRSRRRTPPATSRPRTSPFMVNSIDSRSPPAPATRSSTHGPDAADRARNVRRVHARRRAGRTWRTASADDHLDGRRRDADRATTRRRRAPAASSTARCALTNPVAGVLERRQQRDRARRRRVTRAAIGGASEAPGDSRVNLLVRTSLTGPPPGTYSKTLTLHSKPSHATRAPRHLTTFWAIVGWRQTCHSTERPEPLRTRLSCAHPRMA